MIRATAAKIGIRKPEPLSFWTAGVFLLFLLIFASFPGDNTADDIFYIIPYIMENVNVLLSGEL